MTASTNIYQVPVRPGSRGPGGARRRCERGTGPAAGATDLSLQSRNREVTR